MRIISNGIEIGGVKPKVGMEVIIPLMEQGKDVNREYNIYRLEGVNEIGWIWLSINRFSQFKGGPLTAGGQYDGYNGDLILGPAGEGKWELRMCDERNRIQFIQGAVHGFDIVEAG